MAPNDLLPYSSSLAGTLLAAREAVMAPIRPSLRKANVTEQQWRVLRVLSDGGPLDASTLADQALLHAPSVTRILRELVGRGLVSRETDRADARRTYVSITPAGVQLVSQMAPETVRVLNEYERRFGAKRLAALRGELMALAEIISDCAPRT